MGIYVNNTLTYVAQGASLNTNLNLGSGKYNTVVEEWDHCGGASYTPINITVSSGGGGWRRQRVYGIAVQQRMDRLW